MGVSEGFEGREWPQSKPAIDPATLPVSLIPAIDSPPTHFPPTCFPPTRLH